MKIFYGASKVAVNMGHVTKAKDWLLQDPVFPVLTYASRWSRLTPYISATTNPHDNHQNQQPQNQPLVSDVVASIQRLSSQIIELAQSVQG